MLFLLHRASRLPSTADCRVPALVPSQTHHHVSGKKGVELLLLTFIQLRQTDPLRHSGTPLCKQQTVSLTSIIFFNLSTDALSSFAFVEYEDRRDADDAYHDMHNKRIGRDDILKIEVRHIQRHKASAWRRIQALSRFFTDSFSSGLALLPQHPGASTLAATVTVTRAALLDADPRLLVVGTTLRERMIATAATVTTIVIATRVTVVTLATARALLTLGKLYSHLAEPYLPLMFTSDRSDRDKDDRDDRDRRENGTNGDDRKSMFSAPRKQNLERWLTALSQPWIALPQPTTTSMSLSRYSSEGSVES